MGDEEPGRTAVVARKRPALVLPYGKAVLVMLTVWEPDLQPGRRLAAALEALVLRIRAWLERRGGAIALVVELVAPIGVS
ncbi:MAG: hypothetical protein ACR2KV_01835 [Solirubrobacteraceae bacterium]